MAPEPLSFSSLYRTPSAEQLLSANYDNDHRQHGDGYEMTDVKSSGEEAATPKLSHGTHNVYHDEEGSGGEVVNDPNEQHDGEGGRMDNNTHGDGQSQSPTEFKVYKRRWFGLAQLVLMNIIVSWDWLTYAPIANSTAAFFSVPTTSVNWLSTAFLFAFLIASPATLYILSRSGPRLAIIVSSVFILLGNWLRYAGTRVTPQPSFALVMVGQILTGLAQPFVLAAPTRFSDLWFTAEGRVSATAVASLANPFGGALGQLINPFLATTAAQVPDVTLYVAIISTVATIPSFFIPARPPTPPSASGTHKRPPITDQIRILASIPTFWLLFIPFSVYVGFFNSSSSLLNQFLTPYGYSDTEAGIAGALLILVGLVSAAVTSPIIDRTKRYLLFIKLLVPVIAICYLIFIWAPPSGMILYADVVCAVLGAANFSLVPIALEWLVEVTWPVGPEVGSTICWAGGQAMGGIFIIISNALGGDEHADPPYNMNKALIFQAVVAVATVPTAMLLGVVGSVKNKRLELDKRQRPDNSLGGQ
ncbi:hypothetical protein MMC25_008239 [Agyrium rufum]|nr:hypothetical protein [Agyrium rufum]